MIPSVDLWSIRCFIAVAEELHFGRAAQRLSVTQPTLSQHIRKLETHLGVPVFIRSTRSVELTPSGEAFQPLAREILVKLEEAVLLAKLAAGGVSPGGEQLNIGAIEPASRRLLPLILRRFRNRFPQTRLDVRILDSAELLRALERGDTHVGLMRTPTNANLIRFLPLISDRFVAVIPKDLPLSNQPTLRLADFVGQNVFTLNRFELSSFRAVYDQVVEAGIVTNQNVSVSDTTAALALACAGVGITFLPQWIEGTVGDEVVTRRVEDLNHPISTGIAWRADNPAPGILPLVEYAQLVGKMSGHSLEE